MNILKILLLATAASFTVAACDVNEGIVENSGEAMDSAGYKIWDVATDVGNAVDDACEDVKKSADAKNANC